MKYRADSLVFCPPSLNQGGIHKSNSKHKTMKAIKTREDAINFIRGCIIWIGPAFHPDTFMVDYEDGEGNRLFTKAEVRKNQHGLNECFSILGDDVYSVGSDLLVRLGYAPAPTLEKHSVTFIVGEIAANRYQNYIEDGMSKDDALAAACEDGGEWVAFSFDTNEEVNAFLKGIEAAQGWEQGMELVSQVD